MQHAAIQSAPNNQLLFLPGVFNETLSLLFDAHQYFQIRGPEEQATIETDKQAFYSSEMSRVTLRLTSVMAWIMVRRAVNAGNIRAQKAKKEYRLDGRDRYQSESPEMLQDMPYYFTYLSNRSLDLYERIMRLDVLAYETKH